MKISIVSLLFCLYKCSYADGSDDEVYYSRLLPTADPRAFTIESLVEKSYDTAVTSFPYLAYVTGSEESTYVICMAICIEKQIFTAVARCAGGLMAGVAAVVYRKRHFVIQAVVTADRASASKQYFDDVSFLVVNNVEDEQWPVLPLPPNNRTSPNFDWFNAFNYDDEENIIDTQISAMNFGPRGIHGKLYSMGVTIAIMKCLKLFSPGKNPPKGFFVPCFSPCLLGNITHPSIDKNCKIRMEAEGAVLIHESKRYLFGLASWTLMGQNVPKGLPIGFTVPNSNTTWKLVECARIIRSDLKENKKRPAFYFENLCKQSVKFD